MSFLGHESTSLRGSNSHRRTPRKAIGEVWRGGYLEAEERRRCQFAPSDIAEVAVSHREMPRGTRAISHVEIVSRKCERSESRESSLLIFIIKHNRRAFTVSRAINCDRNPKRRAHKCVLNAYLVIWSMTHSARNGGGNATRSQANRAFESLYAHINWPP